MSAGIDLRDERRVLVLAPTEADAAMTQSLLQEAGVDCTICPDLNALCKTYESGAGALLLTEDVLDERNASCLVELLEGQPSWSDLPVILLTSRGADSPLAAWAMDLLGNVTLLERPVRVTTLVSAVRTALRGRRRQYELRRQIEELGKRTERLRLLSEAAAVLLTSYDPDAMMCGLFTRIAPHFGLDAYFNFMVDDTGEALRMESCMGIPAADAKRISRLEFGQAICGWVALRREPTMATHIQDSCDPRAQLVKGFGLRSYACSPLIVGERLLGTLSFASRTRDSFDPDEVEFFETVCQYVTYAYERLRLIGRLQEEDRKKDDFLATLAHELRNPLAPIRNAEQFLRLKGSDDPDLTSARDIIERQVLQLTRLVDDLLDVSRITRGKIALRRERVSLGVVLTNAIESSRPMVESQRHTLTVGLPSNPLFLHGDLARLTQVFSNLLTNAAKYTEPGGGIRLAAERQGSDVVVSVRDTGIGISAEHLPHVFDMFSQVAPALERSQGGLGIGLSLVKSLVEMHGGRVEARSEGLGAGSEFEVRLPLLVESPLVDETASVRKRTAAPARSPCRVLVADDNVDSAQSLAMMLSLKGHEVRTAFDGQSAVELVEAFRPDLALLDIGMPKLNGYEAAKLIRQASWGKQIVLAALTGWGQSDDKRKADDAGFDRHFTKPVEPDALESLLSLACPQS